MIIQHLNKFIGDKVAVLCARYQYWGFLSEVIDHHVFPAIVLTNAVAVEQSGPSSSQSPVVIDPIYGSVTILLSAIEIVYQPPWSRSALPGE